MRTRFAVLSSRMVKRLFVALDLPEDLARLLAALDPHIDGLRWTPAERLHMTLCFLGNVDDEDQSRLIAALSKVSSASFPLRVKGAGCFSRHGGLVLWAGVQDPSGALPSLHRQVANAVRDAGLDPGPSKLHPHLTLARASRGKPAMVRDFLAETRDREFGDFAVIGITLYSSILRPEGPEYSAEFRRDFAGPPAGEA